MGAIPKISAGYQDTLATGMSASATSFTLSNGKDVAGNALSGLYGLTIDSEWMLATIAAGVGTVVARGCDPSNPMVNVPALQVSHRKGAAAILTDYAFLGYVWQLLTGNFSFDNLLAYTSYILPTLRAHLAPKGYVDDAITGANATASNATAGTVRLDQPPNGLPRALNVYVQQRATPSMALQVLPFSLNSLDQTAAFAGAVTLPYSAPVSHPRIDLLVYSTASSGLTSRTGSENVSPVAPSPLQGDVVLCQIFHRVGEASIKDNDDSTNGYIQAWLTPSLYAPDTLRGASATSYVATTGSANAYVATLSPAPLGLGAGMTLRLKANFTNTGDSTLNVNSLGAVHVCKGGGTTVLAAGDIVSGQLFTVTYDGTNFQLQSQPSSGTVTGTESASVSAAANGSATSTGFSIATDGSQRLFITYVGQLVRVADGQSHTDSIMVNIDGTDFGSIVVLGATGDSEAYKVPGSVSYVSAVLSAGSHTVKVKVTSVSASGTAATAFTGIGYALTLR